MVPSLFTAGTSELEAHARATSSMTITVASASAPDPAVRLGHVRRVQVAGAQRLVGGPAELGPFVDLGGQRRDLGVADLARGRAEGLVLLGRTEHLGGVLGVGDHAGQRTPEVTDR